MRCWIAVVTVAITLVVDAFAGEEPTSVADGYEHPLVTVPYARQKPKIDGIIDEAEWRSAVSTRSLQTVRGQISTRQTRFWMMWDEENIYVAMRSPIRKGERLLRRHRGRDRDLSRIIYDDSYEIWLSVGATDPLTGQLECTTQFLSNFSGARYDLLHQPAVGNSRTGYETGWEPKNRINENNEWEWEVAIPRKSLGTTAGPFHDGMHFRCLLSRNYKRPWEQNSFEGTSSFSVVDTHSRFVMSKSMPALHLLSVGDAEKGVLGLTLAAFGQRNGTVKWRFASDGGVVKEGPGTVQEGKLSTITDLPALDETGDGSFRITVTTADGKTALLDWSSSRIFAMKKNRTVKTVAGNKKTTVESVNSAMQVLSDTGDDLDVRTILNPVKDYVRIFGDFINYDNRAAIKEIVVSVHDAGGRALKTVSTTVDELAYAKAVMPFDDFEPGDYAVTLECKGADGTVLETRNSTFTKKDPTTFAWWNTKRGNIEKVISPWTAVTRGSGNTFSVWGREMTVGPAGLPKRVRTGGSALLAAPARLVAEYEDGTTAEARGEQAKLLVDKDHRKTIQVSSRLGEMDIVSRAMVEFDGFYRVDMTLTPKRATRLKSLKVVIPYNEAMAGYVHAVADGIRSGFYYGYTPKGEGSVWNSTLLDSTGMKVGSFIPYIWIGSPKGGMCFFADSDQGWNPNDATAAIEIRRDRTGQVDLVLNLISAPAILHEPRTLTFGFQASPVKPMHERWREDNWWCGDTFQNYSGANIIWQAMPFCLPEHKEICKTMVESQHRNGRYAVPYFIHNTLPANRAPEMAYFEEHWRTTVDHCLRYGKTLTDYMVHAYGNWAKESEIDGFYVDNMRPVLCDNIEAGRGYRLPDGRVQPTYQMFETRRYFLRIRAAFLEERPRSKIVLHMSNAMIIPWVGAADVAYDGEHHVIYPRMKKDFMDFWTLERLRVDYPGQWGVMVNFMNEFQGQGWDPVVKHKAFRSYFGAVMLQDVLPTGNISPSRMYITDIREAFGIGDANVRFLPYWQADTGISAAGKDVKPAGWLKPDALLLLVANFGEQGAAKVRIDTASLGWGKNARFTVSDPERGHKQDGNRRVKMTEEERVVRKKAFKTGQEARRKRHEETCREAAQTAKERGKPVPKPFEPRPYRDSPYKTVRLVVWDGDKNAPVTRQGNALSVPVERHNYRMLILTKP